MKKKHHKKPRSAKRAAPHTTKHAAHAKPAKRAKRTKRHGERARPEAHSSPLLRAIQRRHEAERDEHREPHEMRHAGHHLHKHGSHPTRKRSHDNAEPVITEKSFEKMLTMRRFQHHTR